MATATTCGMFYNDPVNIGISLQRRALIGAGLEQSTISGTHGDVVVYQGGEGPTLVLVHGFMDQPGSFNEVASDLTSRYHVVIPALAGHGQSAGPSDGHLTLADTYESLEQVMDAQRDGGPAVMLGNSMGGWLTMRYALDHPDRLSRIILMNSSGLSHKLNKAELIPATPQGIQEKTDRIWGDHAPQLPPFMLRALVDYHQQPPMEWLFDHLTADDYVDDELVDLAVPADLIWGTNDGVLPMEYAHRLHGAIPGSRLHEMPGCAHAPQLTCPDLLPDLVDQIIQAGTAAPEAAVGTPH